MKKTVYLILLLGVTSGFLFAKDGDNMVKIKISFNGNSLIGYLNDSVTSKAIIEMLPMTLPMQNLYSREMVYRFIDALPIDNARYTGYEVGEIVYWPPGHSFVFLYAQNGEQFSIQKLGFIESDTSHFKNLSITDITIEKLD